MPRFQVEHHFEDHAYSQMTKAVSCDRAFMVIAKRLGYGQFHVHGNSLNPGVRRLYATQLHERIGPG